MSLESVLLAIGPRDDGHIESLTRTAADIAGPAGATVELFWALTDDEYETALDDLDAETDGERLSPSQLARRHRLIRRAIDHLDAEGVDHEIHGVVGDPAGAIVDAAASLPSDLVVVGGAGRSPAGKAMFGSTPQEVLLKSSCPVVYVRRADGR